MSDVKVCDWLLGGVMCCDDGSRCRFLDHQEECPMSRFDGDEEEISCGDPEQSVEEPLDGAADGREMKVVYLPVDLIDPHPDNPRKSELDVGELAASIKAEGIQQPLTVVPHIGSYDGRYTCVIGHRRLAAAKLAGLKTVPAFIRAMDRREQLRTMMTENTQRRDLTPLEQADGFKQLMLELPEQTAAAVARETGFSETTVRRRMKMLELPREVLEVADERGNVTLADYAELDKIKDPARRAKAAEELGTPDFKGAVVYQAGEERKAAGLERLIEALEKKGAREVTAAEKSDRDGELEHVQSIYRWSIENSTLNPMEKGREYLFVADRDRFDLLIYRVKLAESEAEQTELSDAQKAKAELEARTEDMKADLRALLTEQEAADQELLDRRTEFVEALPLQRHREEIMEAATLMLIRGSWWSEDGMKELGSWLGVEDLDLKAASNETLMSLIRGNPEKALLYTLYVRAERDADGWHTTEYFRGEKYRKYHQQPKQELLYDILRVLGYRKSGEEMLMQGGAHHLQGNAQRIIEQFKADERELKKRINV
jgi:ParB family chromosome partitioning protein